MIDWSSLTIGVSLIGLGLLFWLAARLVIRFGGRERPVPNPARPQSFAPDHNQLDAVLLVHSGGKLTWLNPKARELFGIQTKEAANLERLARAVRPTDALFNLCAAESRLSFVVNGKLVEGVSYWLPQTPQPGMLLTLRSAGVNIQAREGEKPVLASLQTLADLSRDMTSRLGLVDTLQAVMESYEKLVAVDYLQICVWEQNGEVLIPYLFSGYVEGERHVEQLFDRYLPGEGNPGFLVKSKQARLFISAEEIAKLQPVPLVGDRHICSYLGMPLTLHGRSVGTLELGALQEGQYQQSDLEIIRLLGEQAAVAIYKAQQYDLQKRRADELGNLVDLSRAFSSMRDPKEVFTRLLESIAPLIDVHVLGFLIFNENDRLLSAQIPFLGIPAQVVSNYGVQIAANSPLEKVMLDQDVLFSDDAMSDPRWESFGLEMIARAASIRETVLIPLLSGGRILGYIQAANHRRGSQPFTNDELQLLSNVASQVSPVIANSALVQQTRLRAQRAEGLRRIASLASSDATLDEVLGFSLRELTNLIHPHVAGIFLVDRRQQSLTFHQTSYYGSLKDLPTLPLEDTSIQITDVQYPFTVTGSQHGLYSGDLQEEKAVIPFYRRLIEAFGLRSAVVVPLVVRKDGVGEIWLGSREPGFFNQGDLQVVVTAAGQLASVVEQSYLIEQTDENLRRRVQQVSAIDRINRESFTSQDVTTITQTILGEMIHGTGADCGNLMLFDRGGFGGESLRVWLSSGEAHPKQLLPVELRALEEKQTLLIDEVDSQATDPLHPDIKSLLLVPILHANQTVGLFSMHGKQTHQFDQTSVDIAQSLATQTAVVLRGLSDSSFLDDNQRTISLDQRAINWLTYPSEETTPRRDTDAWFSQLTQDIREITSFQMVVISQYDPTSGLLKRVFSSGLPESTWQELKGIQQSWKSLQAILKPHYRQGNAFFIPFDGQLETAEGLHTVTPLPLNKNRMIGRWHAEDMLLVPIMDLDQNPLGLISLDSPKDGNRPGRRVFDGLNLIALQAAYLFLSHRNQPDQQEEEIHPEGIGRESEMILIQSLQEIADKVSRQTDLQNALKVTALELMRLTKMDKALCALRDGGRIQLLDIIGDIPDGMSVEALLGQNNPLRETLLEGEFYFANDQEGADAWSKSPLMRGLKARSFLSLPFKVSEDCDAGLLLITSTPQKSIELQDRGLFMQFARQVSVSLQNLYLITETRRRLEELHLLFEFTRKISNLDQQAILETLVSSTIQTIHEAKAGWVATWQKEANWLQPIVADGYRDNQSLLNIRFSLPADVENQDSGRLPLPVRVYLSKKIYMAEAVDFSRDYHLSAENLIHYRHATGGPVPLSCLAAPLSLGDAIIGVIILDNFETSNAFTRADEAVLQSFAQQATLALENARLFATTEQRAAQLQSLTHVASLLSGSLHSKKLVEAMLDLLGEVVPFDTGTLWLRNGNQLVISDARGFNDLESRRGISVDISDSQLFQSMLVSQTPLVVADVRKDARFHALVESDYLSWMGVPLVYKSELIGVIALEKREAEFYQPEYIQAAQTVASQAAVTLENARLFEESLQRTADLDEQNQRLALLNQFSGELGMLLHSERIFELTVNQIRQALRVDHACVADLDEDQPMILLEKPAYLSKRSQRLPVSQLLSRLKLSSGVYNNHQIEMDREIESLYEAYFRQIGIQSLLILPLVAGEKFYGWIWAMRKDATRFSPAEIELARTICNQASISLQNATLYEETTQFSKTLEEKVRERTEELSKEHLNTETLLRLSEELSRSLDVSEVINRALMVLNQPIGAKQCLIVRTLNPQQTFSIGENLLRWDGLLPKAQRWIEEQLYAEVIRQGETISVENIQREMVSREIEAEEAPHFQSLLVLPLKLGSELLGVTMLAHDQAGFFREEQKKLLEAGARQISIALNNMTFVEYIREAAEEQGRMLREQQIESNRSKAILEAVADGVLVTDSQNRVSLMNKSAQEIFGISATDYLGKTIHSLSGLIGSQEAEKSWIETIQAWSISIKHYQGETFAEQVMLDNGRTLAVHAAPVFFMGGFLGTVSVFRDVTHEVQIDRMKSEFIANVSHELRTPITSIKGYVQVLLMGAAGELNDQQRHFLDIVANNTSRLTVLVNDLLDISRIETSRLTLTIQPVDLAEVAADVVADVLKRSRDEGKAMNIQLELTDAIHEVNGDRARLRQVMHSLVSNAYNYTPANGDILVSISAGEGMVRVDIKDNGIGISPADKSRIFERFFRGADPLVLGTAGTGLGLAIAKTLVEMHHGKIWFESSGVRGEGSTFSFSLPTDNEEK